MCERLDVMGLTQIVHGPPTKDFIDGSGELVKEPSVLIGYVAVGRDRRQYLEDLGVDMRWAEYYCDSERWERCLMSEGVADLLEDLHAEGDFPYGFEIGPSEGEVAWLKAKARGASERPELPLHAYLRVARAEDLDALVTGSIQKGAEQRRRKHS